MLTRDGIIFHHDFILIGHETWIQRTAAAQRIERNIIFSIKDQDMYIIILK